MTTFAKNISASLPNLEKAMNRKMTGNASLRHEEWLQYDQALVDVTRQRATTVGYLLSKGLSASSDLGTTVAFYEQVSDLKPAEISMYVDGNPNAGTVTFGEVGTRIPLIHEHFNINERQLIASRRRGASLDMTNAAAAGANVWIAANNMLANGAPHLGTDNQVYGLLNRPGRITATITAGAWNGTAGSNEDDRGLVAYKEANDIITEMHDLNFHGPFTFIVSTNIANALELDYNRDKGTMSTKQRIESFTSVEAVIPCDQFPDDKVVCLQTTPDVIDWFSVANMQTLEYEAPWLNTQYMVFMGGAPRIKINRNGDVGLASN